VEVDVLGHYLPDSVNAIKRCSFFYLLSSVRAVLNEMAGASMNCKEWTINPD